jgi:hypothetical protein
MLRNVWAVPKADRPGLAPRYLRTVSLLLLLGLTRADSPGRTGAFQAE